MVREVAAEKWKLTLTIDTLNKINLQNTHSNTLEANRRTKQIKIKAKGPSKRSIFLTN